MLLLSHVSMAKAYPAIDIFWEKLLKKHTVSGVRSRIRTRLVDYQALSESQTLNMLVRLIASDTHRFNSETDRLAFHINAYNIAVIHAIIESELYRYPLGSPDYMTAQKFMNSLSITIHGNSFTLVSLYQHIISTFNDPKILFSLCNGTLSSPPLSPTAFTESEITRQLDNQIYRFLANKKIGYHALKSSKKLFLSPLFQQHSNYFHTGIIGFLKEYSDTPNLTAYTIYNLPVNNHLNSRQKLPKWVPEVTPSANTSASLIQLSP